MSKENSELEKTEKEIRSLENLLKSSNDFQSMILNPTIGKFEQEKAIIKISDYLGFSQTFKNFLGLLVFKRRLFFLNKIIDSFLNLVSLNKGELIAQLLSSKKLSNEEINNIKKSLSEYLGRSVIINYKLDLSLIGGFKIQVESTMIDASIKNKLQRLEKIMIES